MDYIIMSSHRGRISRWDGHYGWVFVPICQPWKVNGAYRYKTLGAAQKALYKMKDSSRRIVSPNARRARIVELDSLMALEDKALRTQLLLVPQEA